MPEEKIEIDEFRNKFSMEYISIAQVNGPVICDYLIMRHIEKTRGYFDEPGVFKEWAPHSKSSDVASCRCSKCFNFATQDEDTPWNGAGITTIKVDNSYDMLPLYMKWALRLKGIGFDSDGFICSIDGQTLADNAGSVNRHLMETLGGLYENVNGKNRLRNFTECKCEKCGKEWIILDKEEK